ncbi:MAG: DNA-deoxyinosine glycosylase [Lachnospiraceae bacterium]|jgi:hypoxanthine-DNA glycosylase|nr:DNA-deoxyinosine glycosylase [Lachnospiraceae bacterium]
MRLTHPLAPIYDEHSKVLILGTFPSPKSREVAFYYGHPQNRFWRVMADVMETEVPQNNEEKTIFLLKNKIALWDVIHSCEIVGAADGSIKNPIVNNFSEILCKAEIKAVFTTGMTATRLYQKHCLPKTNIPAVCLPSTSPANRSCSFEVLVEKYGAVRQFT